MNINENIKKWSKNLIDKQISAGKPPSTTIVASFYIVSDSIW